MINIDNIKRNSHGFSFVDTLGSFINNYEFSEGYRKFQESGDATKEGYIWAAISAIGGNYAETIYENVLNYIDNVSNVDLCKVKNLQSMIKILGIDYNIINDVEAMPIELVNLIDILSINKHYLTDNKCFREAFMSRVSSVVPAVPSEDAGTFASSFMSELSAFDEGKCFVSADFYSTLSSDIGPKYDEFSGEVIEAGEFQKSFGEVSAYLDNEKYYQFLTSTYRQVLTSYVFMQYADAEAGLSTTNQFIYEYISDKLLAKNNATTSTDDSYDKQIRDLKIKYRLEKFKQDEVVDAIENGQDSLDRYNAYQQIVLKKEIERRSASYPYDKSYLESENDLGFSITRYSYYREKKVKEYFDFIENTYNSLIRADEIYSSIQGSGMTHIEVYDKDVNYFNVDSQDKKSLLWYDSLSKSYSIQVKYINAVAQLLADQTLELADIRDQIKIQLRKSYLKGTFLLLSYIINEYLKYNVAKHYGDVFYSDENVALSTFIYKSITEGENIELLEYFDPTEYYNVSSDSDATVESDLSVQSIKIKNKDLLNEKFWDNLNQKLGQTTGDLPLEEIDDFYRKQLKMNLNCVETSANLVNFLSILYSYGANDTFIDETNDQFMCQVQSQDLSGREWIGDIDKSLSSVNSQKTLIQNIIDEVNDQIANGYHPELDTVQRQIEKLSGFVSSYWFEQISSANADLRDQILDGYNANLELNEQMSVDLQNLSNDFKNLSSDAKYEVYLKNYNPTEQAPGVGDQKWFITQLSNFQWSCQNEKNRIEFKNKDLREDVIELCSSYGDVQTKLSNLIENYVREEDKWPYYFTNSNDEITSQTRDLATYLQSESDTAANSIHEHLQNHLDKLVAYKNDVNNMIDTFIETSSLYVNFEHGVFNTTNTSYLSGSFSWRIFERAVLDKDGSFYGYEMGTFLTSYEAFSPSDPIFNKLDALRDRCDTWFIVDDKKVSNLKVTSYNENGYPNDREWTTAYIYSKYKKWADAYSKETATQIRANLEKLSVDFGEVQKMINIELDCLGSTIGSINITGVTVDNIGSKLKDLFAALLEKIKTLDDSYVKVKKFVATDAYYSQLASKLDIIKWILNSSPLQQPHGSYEIYNIKWIEDDFNKVYKNYTDLKNTNKGYLSEWSDSGVGTLKEQFADLYAWMLQHDLESKEKIVAEVSKIIIQYYEYFTSFKDFTKTLFATTIVGVTNDLVFLTEIFPYDGGPIAFYDEYLQLVENWLHQIVGKLEEDSKTAINAKVKVLQAYKDSIYLIKRLKELLATKLLDVRNLMEVLEELIETIDKRLEYIEKSRESYDAQREIFLKYSGMDIGYDPFYNYKNLTHSSYQIHPYLYNFIEKSNLAYPLANTFFISFTTEYEKELVSIGLDNIIGKQGNIINLWKYGMFDWTGYQSQYEHSTSGVDVKTIPDSFGFTGAFYPPALDAFLADTETFIQTVQDNRPESFYYKLNLSQEELNKITEQLRIYETAIREIAQRQRSTNRELKNPCLSNEYDIYKYAEDVYGNSLILFKSYDYIIDKHAQQEVTEAQKMNLPDRWHKNEYGNWEYHPSYNEKKNAPGELWVRAKNHPIAFPAFDMREDQEEYTFYDSSEGYKHEYIEAVNKYFGNDRYFGGTISEDSFGHKLIDITRDSISRGNNNSVSHFRCFFDMELDVEKKTLLLVAPYQTGENHLGTKSIEEDRPNIWQSFDTFTYANSDIIVGSLGQWFDYANNLQKYTFTQYSNSSNVENVTNNIDNIKAPLKLLRANSKTIPQEIYDFIGFSKHNSVIYSVFVHKYYPSMKFQKPLKPSAKKELHLYYVAYTGSQLLKYHLYHEVKHDILYKGDELHKYANALAITTNNKTASISYISEEFQKPVKVPGGMKYTNDAAIVNFTEYTSTVEKDDFTGTYGQNKKYPSDTAVLQTTDAAHINIYNSFDSFTSYIVTIDFKFVGKKMVATTTKHYNINTDLGYLPLFADTHGKSRIYNNSALSAKEQYSLELLGPENSDVDYTPVIIDQADERYGRVTEDWKEYSKLTAFSKEIRVPSLKSCATCTFALSDVFVDSRGRSTYDELAETNQLTNYSYTFTNLAYTALPIAKGKLKDQWPLSNFYLSSEKYDLLSGQEIFGPNGTSYQGIQASNHIDNISAVNLEVVINPETALPIAVNVSCMTRQLTNDEQIIPENKFMLLLYAKNSLGSYDYYRIIENANSQLKENPSTKMTRSEENDIVFSEISSLGDYTQEVTGKKPFANQNIASKKANEMSAMLEFKYSEEETVDREFPYLPVEDVEDEVVIVSNENQYIYFYALDSFDTISKDVFYMDRYDPQLSAYKKVKVNTTSRKYQDFYNRAMTIEATYNVEEVVSEDEQGQKKYQIVQYFNYKNFTSPCYVKFDKGEVDENGKWPIPEANFYPSNAKEIQHTYLVLRPGQSGRLDIQFDYVEYAKVHQTDITQSIVGKETRVVKSYFIMNVSDEKPKFIISKKPFKN